MSLFDKFKKGLSLSSLNLSTGIKNIFSTKNIDESVLSQFEELLISADVGVETANELRKEFEKLKIDKDKISRPFFSNNNLYLIKDNSIIKIN